MGERVKLSRDNDSEFLIGLLDCNDLFNDSPYLIYANPPKHMIEMHGKNVIKAKPERSVLSPEGEVDVKGLRKIIEENKGFVKIILRNYGDESFITYFDIPPARPEDPYIRELIY